MQDFVEAGSLPKAIYSSHLHNCIRITLCNIPHPERLILKVFFQLSDAGFCWGRQFTSSYIQLSSSPLLMNSTSPFFLHRANVTYQNSFKVRNQVFAEASSLRTATYSTNLLDCLWLLLSYLPHLDCMILTRILIRFACRTFLRQKVYQQLLQAGLCMNSTLVPFPPPAYVTEQIFFKFRIQYLLEAESVHIAT